MKPQPLFITVLAIGALTSCYNKIMQQPPERTYPMFWTWMDYNPSMNFDSVCAVMQETGIDGVMLNAATPDDYRKAVPVARKYGIEVYAWLWTMNLEHDRDRIVKEHPDWLSVNRLGQSLADTTAYVGYYKFLCPALPEVRQYIKENVREYCKVKGLGGIAIDYHRFVDVILPSTLWAKYDVVQDREYPEWDYGYHPAMLAKFKELYGYDPRDQDDPTADEQWLQFRCDQITEVANEIAEVVHSFGKVMAASPFPTPRMSRQMVRQDWGKWNLDIVFPMVYHNFYTEDPSFISDCTIENARDKNPQTTLYCGLMARDTTAMIDYMDEALNNGAEGIAIFTVDALRSPEVRRLFRAYTDRARERRTEAAFIPAFAADAGDVNTNPFEKEGVMSLVRQKMQEYAKSDNLQLSEYTLVEEYGENAGICQKRQSPIERIHIS
ncbi:hypothetical protein Barb6_01629 [Bacteroidales bacterium Barb6]|nr:hypothetical protein Barb6_01629 [Bacteroidales bacterium Barb6]